MDESGHDHRTTPYEVRGGVALETGRLWSFVRAMRSLEEAAFGDNLHNYGSEIKGHKLLDKDKLKFALQATAIDDATRRKLVVSFLNKGLRKSSPNRDEFTAYGQACLLMARGIFNLLVDHDAVLFASAIPRECTKPDTYEAREFLRKDHVFLLERYFHFLEDHDDVGLLVMDETEKAQDRRFVRHLERYFTATANGRIRATRIVPSPFFVASDMVSPIQAADVCIYCINWGFRLPSRGMDGPVRPEIAGEFEPWLSKLQYEGQLQANGLTTRRFGIAYVPDQYKGK